MIITMLRLGFNQLASRRRLTLIMALVITFPLLAYLLLDSYRNGMFVLFAKSSPSYLVAQSSGSMGEFYGSRIPAQLNLDLAAHGATFSVPEIHTIVGATPATAIFLRGIPLDTYKQVEDFHMLAGRPLKPGDEMVHPVPRVMIGIRLAEKFNLVTGGTIDLRGRAFQVVGIFSVGTYADYEAWVPLRDAQALLGWGTDVSVFVIRSGSGLKPGDSLPGGVSIVPKGDSGADFIQEWAPFFSLLRDVVTALGLAAVVALANLLSRLAWQRRHELAILRSLGFDQRALGFYLGSQGLVITLLGYILGVLGALTLGRFFEASTAGFTLRAVFNANMLLSTLFFALLLALAGSVLPAWQLSRFNLVDLLRDEAGA